MANRRLFYVLSIIFLLLNCQSWQRKDFVNPLPPPKKPPEAIEISYTLPEKNHELLSEIVVQYNQGYEREKIFAKLKKLASKSGADGIVLTRFSQKSEEFLLYGGKPGTTVKNEQFEIRALFYRYVP